MHWDWFAIITFFFAYVGFAIIKEKLDRIVKLLEEANEQRSDVGTGADKPTQALHRIEHHLAKLTKDIPDEETWWSKTFGEQPEQP